MDMPFFTTLALSLLSVALQIAPAANPTKPVDDPPSVCASCDEWNLKQQPFQIHGPSYYVGTKGLSSLLIKTTNGLIVLDGGLPQSAPLIEDNIKALGFRVEDIKLIVNSHAHYDHAGGIARLQRDSGARVAAGPAGARSLIAGFPVREDPQFDRTGKEGGFPKVQHVEHVKDGEVLRVGDIKLTAHLTPGHTPGGATWTWSSCDAKGCLDFVYADSLTAVSLDDFRYTGDATHPDVTAQFRATIQKVSALPCDIVVSAHPGATSLFEKLKRSHANPGWNAFVDSKGCAVYAQSALKRLEERVQTEQTAARK